MAKDRDVMLSESELDGYRVRIAALEAELAKVRLERDAAVALLRRVQSHGLDEGQSMSKRENAAGVLHADIARLLMPSALTARKEGA